MAEKGDLEDVEGAANSSRGSTKKMKMTVDERIMTAESYKNDGNKYYKEKNYRAAIGKYHRGLLYLKDLDDKRMGLGVLISGLPFQSNVNADDYVSELTNEQNKNASKLQVDLYNNLAACLLQSPNPNYEKIVQYCDCVLTIQPENVKALYRRGMALYYMKAYDDSRECLLHAKSHCKGTVDPNIRKYLKMCSVAIGERQAQEKSRYQGMFDKVVKENGQQ